MNTQTVVNAVSALNASRQREVEREAQTLILQIRDEQKSIKGYEESIALSQADLKKLVDFTTENIVGGTLPNNANSAVIQEVIAKQQKAQVEGPASCYARNISERQNAIKACNDRIAEARKKLNELAAQSVTVEQVVGK